MPAPEDYIAGAVVANAIAWIVTGLVESVPYLWILLYVAGSVLAGFLVARKAGGEIFWKVGLKSGLGAFVLHMFLVTGMEIVMDVRMWSLEAHLVVLSVFLLGGISGAFLLSLVRRGEAVKSG